MSKNAGNHRLLSGMSDEAKAARVRASFVVFSPPVVNGPAC
jgi:hypothetical protein